jgi:hypothetical protein
VFPFSYILANIDIIRNFLSHFDGWEMCLIIIFFEVLECELRVLSLVGRGSTTWATPPALFALGYFSDTVLRFAWASLSLWCSYLWPFCVAGVTGTWHHNWLIDWHGLSLMFFLCWSWTMILLISASWVVRITDVSYCIWLP